MRNNKWESMRFLHQMGTSEPVDALRQLLISEHKLGGSQGLWLYLGEATAESALIKPEDYALPISNLRVPSGSKNDQIIQVVTYSYQPFASILNIPRDVRPPPMKEFRLPGV